MADLTDDIESSEAIDLHIERVIREAEATHRSITFDEFDDFPDESSWADDEGEFIAQLTNKRWH